MDVEKLKQAVSDAGILATHCESTMAADDPVRRAAERLQEFVTEQVDALCCEAEAG